MPADARINEAERRRWNDECWASVWPKREQLIGAVTSLLLERVGLKEGETVLDVGSGAGIATIAAARVVGPDGSVVGADISAPLVEFATKRSLAEAAVSARFVVADVQQETVDGAPFDVAISQFGVMFFEDPVKAFANIRSLLIRGGRLGFACWQTSARNRWFVGPVVQPFVTPPTPLPGRAATGPFAFASPELVLSILAQSGWEDVEHRTYELTVTVSEDAIVDDDQLRFLGVEQDHFDEARRAVGEHLSSLRRGEGRLDAPLAFQIFTARSPAV